MGANIGYDSLLGSAAVGATGSVVAIEPSPTTFRRLCKNLTLNHATNVRTVCAAITASSCTVPLYRGFPGNIGAASLVKDRGNGIEGLVSGIAMADALLPEERSRLRLIKIDIEGAEQPLLEYFLVSLSQYRDDLEIIVEIDPTMYRGATLTEIFERFAALGFKAWRVPNAYDSIDDYLDFSRAASPEPLTLPLLTRQDILFSKTFPD